MVLKKKTIIILTLVILIVAAAYVSNKYGRALNVDSDKEDQQGQVVDNTDDVITSSQSTGYFIDVKLGRENERTALKQELTSLIDNENTTTKSKEDAEKQYLDMINRSESEMVIENLIKAKDFEDAVVLLTDNTADVTVRAKEIKADQASIIKNIVCRVSGLPASKITLQCKE